MIGFKDKKILEGYDISSERALAEALNMFPPNKHGNIVDALHSLSNKMVDDFIATGKMDAYIAKYGLTSVDEMKSTISGHIAAVLVGTMNHWKYATTENWRVPYSAIKTSKSYSESVDKVTPKGFSYSTFEHRPTEKYASELSNIMSIVREGMPESAKSGERFDGTMSIMTEFISDEIRTKEDLFITSIEPQIERTLSSKTPSRDLDKYFGETEGRGIKKATVEREVDDVIDKFMNSEFPVLFDNMSESQKAIVRQEMKRHIVENICNALRSAESSLYNETTPGRMNIKNYDVGVDTSFVTKIMAHSDKIMSVTLSPQVEDALDCKRESWREEGYDIDPEEEWEYDSIQQIHRVRSSCESSIRVAIVNGIQEGIQDYLQYQSNKEQSLGNEVLSSDTATEKPKGAIGRFIDNKSQSEPNRDEQNKDEEIL